MRISLTIKSMIAHAMIFSAVFLFALTSSPQSAQAEGGTMVIDLSQLSVIKDTLKTVNDQLQELYKLTNIQNDILASIGSLGCWENSSGEQECADDYFPFTQGIMELACGKFQFPQFDIRFPIPNIKLPDLPDSLCDWFGYGKGYQSNFWQQVFGDLKNSDAYTRAMGYIDCKSDLLQQEIAANGNNVYCGIWSQREKMFGRDGNPSDCPKAYTQDTVAPRSCEELDEKGVPVQLQQQVRAAREQMDQLAQQQGQTQALTSLNQASSGGAQMKSLQDMSKNAKNLQSRMAAQNAILNKIVEQNFEIIKLLSHLVYTETTRNIKDTPIIITDPGNGGK